MIMASVLMEACQRPGKTPGARQGTADTVQTASSHSRPSLDRTADTSNRPVTRAGSPFGVALGRDTVWMDSTLLIDAARAIGVRKLAAFEDDTTTSIACGQTKESVATYVVMYANRGDRARVNEIRISRVAPRAAPVLASCVALPLSESEVSTTTTGVRLGTRRAAIEQWAGAPAEAPSDSVARYILGDSSGSEPDQPDRRVILIIKYHDGAVVSLDIHRNDRFLDGPCC